MLSDADLDLPPGAGLRAVTRRLRAAMGRIVAPDPGFSAPPPFNIIRTTDELQRAGIDLDLCVALPDWQAGNHHSRLISGTHAYLSSTEPRLLAVLRRLGCGVWFIEQISGPSNEAPQPRIRRALNVVSRQKASRSCRPTPVRRYDVSRCVSGRYRTPPTTIAVLMVTIDSQIGLRGGEGQRCAR